MMLYFLIMMERVVVIPDSESKQVIEDKVRDFIKNSFLRETVQSMLDEMVNPLGEDYSKREKIEEATKYIIDNDNNLIKGIMEVIDIKIVDNYDKKYGLVSIEVKEGGELSRSLLAGSKNLWPVPVVVMNKIDEYLWSLFFSLQDELFKDKDAVMLDFLDENYYKTIVTPEDYEEMVETFSYVFLANIEEWEEIAIDRANRVARYMNENEDKSKGQELFKRDLKKEEKEYNEKLIASSRKLATNTNEELARKVANLVLLPKDIEYADVKFVSIRDISKSFDILMEEPSLLDYYTGLKNYLEHIFYEKDFIGLAENKWG